MPGRRPDARTTRRALLGAGLAGTAVVAGCDSDSAAPGEPASTASETTTPPPADPFQAELTVPEFDPDDWASVRAQSR